MVIRRLAERYLRKGLEWGYLWIKWMLAQRLKAPNNQVDKMICTAKCLLIGFMNRMSIVIGMKIIHGLNDMCTLCKTLYCQSPKPHPKPTLKRNQQATSFTIKITTLRIFLVNFIISPTYKCICINLPPPVSPPDSD